ncbi:ribonuclease HII [Halonotius terrestris]|uniref:Ribonuclease HII n=1 Tax=Halonotius terrestris TaxID=2487750 RepID=A0A8J8P9Z8_9EURY|nr:ribonuclease HII [Halonotius terrestris]TQQ81256.1 ribonuclease HII [Halonotius terrestris]
MATYQIGVDEAGKGPVLGPMVAAAVRADEADLPDGIDDSKRLSESTRESIATQLRESPAVAVGVGVVTTDEIDDPETDMNSLTVAAQVRALSDVAEDGDHAIVDAGDVSESRFARRVADGVAKSGIDIDVTAEHGADESNRLAGAASVVAKVERDSRIAALDEEYDADIGSGYPSDPTTREFLAAYVDATGEVPPCARRSWSTCEELLTAAEQSGLDDF